MQDDKANKQKAIAEFRALPTKLGMSSSFDDDCSPLTQFSPTRRQDDAGSTILGGYEEADWRD